MRLAVGTTGDNLDAFVGSEFGWCARFVIVDTESMGYFVVVQPVADSHEQASLAAIRTLAQHNVSTVITATVQPSCCQMLNQLGIDVVQGVQGLTVRQAVERFLSAELYTAAGRQAKVKVAVASDGDTLDAPVGSGLGLCSRFLLVDPETMEYHAVAVTPKASIEALSVDAIRAVAKGGANVVITPQLQPRCCRVLFQLGMEVALCPPGITVRQAVEQWQAGQLARADLAVSQ